MVEKVHCNSGFLSLVFVVKVEAFLEVEVVYECSVGVSVDFLVFDSSCLSLVEDDHFKISINRENDPHFGSVSREI